MDNTGKFIISLDFELMWGVRDKEMAKNYGNNIIGVREVLPRMLEAFERYQVSATFATVGFLFASNKEELIKYCPERKPKYDNEIFSPYNGYFDVVGENEEFDKYHFATELLELLRKYPNQEIATHTFSHYFCLENGQTKNEFRDDLEAAIEIAKTKDISIESLVFPKNQLNEDYLELIKDLGITSYRGNEKAWFYSAEKDVEEQLYKRAFRLLDAYFNISGHNCYSLEEMSGRKPFNIPSSRFLRPYSPTLKIIEKIRLSRILKSMTYAAKNKKAYHLWWHPHNFGVHQNENFNVLAKILSHFKELNTKYNFQSITMSALAGELTRKEQ